MRSTRFTFRNLGAAAVAIVTSSCSALTDPGPTDATQSETVGATSEAIATTPTDLCEFTVYAKQQATLQDRATSATGFVGSGTAVSLGHDSIVTGHVRSTGSVVMQDRARVNGNVTAGGTVARPNNTVVTGTVSQNTPVAALTIPTKTVTFGTTDVSVGMGQTRSLAPGNYRDLHPFAGSTLNLRTGTYNLRSFFIESSTVRINLDIASGPIDINVQNELRFGDSMIMTLVGGSNPRQVRYYTNWPNQLNIGNDLTLFGVVTAPSAAIVGFSRTRIRGSVFGRTVSLGPDNGISGACECGNGFLDPNEQCDDGNTNNADGCTNACKTAVCGDGIVRTGVEQCDDGNANDNDACTNACKTAVCGDGIVRTGVEQCDDANTSNTDACLNGCLNATCGDGFVRTGFESCDDGNTNPNDDCTDTCAVATCGDGIVHTGVEECDDGNTDDLDSCTTPTGPGTCVDGADGECGCEFRPLRKNIATISASERTALINAIRELDVKADGWVYLDGVSADGGVSYWDKQDEIHEFTHVHVEPNFLSWHRELLNRFERLLRRVDPTVALHYWDWTTDPILGAVNLFTPATFGLGYFADCSTGGCAPPRDALATPVRAGFPFDIMDSIGPPASASRPSYSTPTTDFGLPVPEITRNVICDGSQFPSDASLVANPVWSTTATQSGFRQALTQVHNNSAHSCIGGTIVDPHTAFEDPFVFIMHSNVDRLWAAWQTQAGQTQRLTPATAYGDGSATLGDESNDPDLVAPLQPWAGNPPYCKGFIPAPPAGCPVFPWDTSLPLSSDPDSRPIDKSSKDPGVVRPPRYDTNGTL